MNEGIQFPDQDSKWIEIQEKVISVAGKPIEDLARYEIRALSVVFTPDEQKSVRWYRQRNGLEKSSRAHDGIVSHRSWEDRHCDRTFYDIADFIDTARCVIMLLGKSLDGYDDILAEFKRRFTEYIDQNSKRWQSAERDDGRMDGNGEPIDIDTWLACNVSRILPTEEGNGLLYEFYERLTSREEELGRQKEKECKPKWPWPLPVKGWVYQVKVIHVRGCNSICEVLWAKNESQARRKILVKFHERFPRVRQNHWPFRVESKKCERGDFLWNYYFKNGGKCE